MKKMINLLFALLLSLSIISCGSSDGGGNKGSGGGLVMLPGASKGIDNTPKNPKKDDSAKTGTSSESGCSEASTPLPGCKV